QHHGLTALGGDHHEHAVGWKQAPVMEFLQDLLTVLAAAQVIVVEDHVILIAPTQGQGFLAATHRVDVVHTHLPKHADQGCTEVGEVIHYEKAQTAVVDHWKIRLREVAGCPIVAVKANSHYSRWCVTGGGRPGVRVGFESPRP